MGTGASNQVRSRSEENTSVSDTVCSFSGYKNDVKQTRKERTCALGANNIATKQSETPANQQIKTNESWRTSQLIERRSLPSPSLQVRKNSQEEIDSTFKNLSKHDLLQKIRELELALAMSDSHKLDLQDQIQALEARCSATAEKLSSASTNNIDTLQTLNSKDQQITKLEEDLKNVQTEFQKKTLKYKKRIRGLTKQIFELRQEMSITQLEVKAQISQQNDLAENHLLITPVSSKDSGISHFESKSDNNHTKIIVELSTQISDLGEQIATLTAEIAVKTQRIKQLETALKETQKSESTTHVVPSSRQSETLNNDAITTTNRKLSSKEETVDNSSNNTIHLSAFNHTRNGTSAYSRSNTNSHTGAHHKSALEQHSTALSDSDSDWSEGPSLPNVHRHSAPAQSRITSSLSKQNKPRRVTTKDMNLLSDDECFMNKVFKNTYLD